MYREKIGDYYEHLSRSYRKVADFVLSNYYEVSFMTAAQLAFAVGVDTTTVVRFSQRLGYNGYPELLQDVREQVRAEIYAHYEPPALAADDPAGVVKARIQTEQSNLGLMLVHNPPDHVRRMAALLAAAPQIVLIAEGDAAALAAMTAQQLRRRGKAASAAPVDPSVLAGVLVSLTAETLLIGIGVSGRGREVARAMQFARARGCRTLGIVGSLSSPVNRMSDVVLYAPSDAAGPLPSVVAIATALAALVMVASADSPESAERTADSLAHAYSFLVQPETEVPDEEE